MKTKLTLGMATALAVACSALFSASPSRTKWSDEEARAWLESKWQAHCKQYGRWSNNVFFVYSINTNWSIATLSNGKAVELGFRDDGVVVWRPKR